MLFHLVKLAEKLADETNGQKDYETTQKSYRCGLAGCVLKTIVHSRLPATRYQLLFSGMSVACHKHYGYYLLHEESDRS